MTVEALFPTLIYRALLLRVDASLNRQLLRECLQLREDDSAGRRWSVSHYPGGFTSYGSAHRMHRLSSTFDALRRRIDIHVRRFARALELDLSGRELAMTDCWVNIMPPRVAHGLHLHPLSTISGTYYVRTPRRSSALKFEDPRLSRQMAAPPRRTDAQREHRAWVSVPAEAGRLVLFESWLRHEVPPNVGAGERISVSFNYNWF
ncbi:MAG: hypothetical protein JSS24_03395 [Proteobacteria bacterium]|nr:hypothetical protein [Pseudomonadota bacterium]